MALRVTGTTLLVTYLRISCLIGLLTSQSISQEVVRQTKGHYYDAFRQLEEAWPTATRERLASGAPGPDYWQQKADYKIQATLDEARDTITGEATITYHNRSPHTLTYLWMHLDQNRFSKHSVDFRSRGYDSRSSIDFWDLDYLLHQTDFPGGMQISQARDTRGRDLSHVVVGSQMRLDLPEPLSPHSTFVFQLRWSAKITPIRTIDGRAGVEQLEGTNRKIYTIAQWYPRMTVYSDQRGWHIQQFLGTGEFALEFGDYDVTLTVPADHIVSATGELQNAGEVLTPLQNERLAASSTAPSPVYVVAASEVQEREKTIAEGTRTWHYRASNVRDFAFASSRSFIWQAWGVKVQGKERPVSVMAFYPTECSPLWDHFAIHATAQAIEVYSRHAFPYPFPVINTVNYGSSGGMEFPMITFTAGRVDLDPKTGDRTYSYRDKLRVIGIIIHETGHQFFPMTVNSDERQWMWLDEGINSFLESLATRNWEPDWPQRADDIAKYMQGENQVPVMTQADQLLQVGNNAYAKVAAGLTLLREQVLGRELFDDAFQEYGRRWQFKRPTPADFFRTMEDASGVDLDWFWRGWFYSTDHVDLAIDSVHQLRLDSRNPDREKEWERQKERDRPLTLAESRDQAIQQRVDRFPELKDFYSDHDPFTVTNKDRNEFDSMLKKLKPWQRELLKSERPVYAIQISNLGGLVMPVPMKIEYADGSQEELTLDQALWRRHPKQVIHLLVRDKSISSITIDPHHDLYDADYGNNHFPRKIEQERLRVEDDKSDPNLMKDIREERTTPKSD